MTDKIATRESYGKTLVKLGAEMDNLVVMDADLSGSTKTNMFAKEFPERFFNMGIAEQNLYGAAAGLAISGKVVCASTFAMFAAGRAFEIIRNSIGYTKANVKICATHAGITVGEDGASHQTFEDIALMSAIPGMTVINPGDGISAEKLITQAIEMTGPAYIRLGRSAVPTAYREDDEIILGKGNVLREGRDITLVGTGIMVYEALEAARELHAAGIEAKVIDIHTVKPIDKDLLIKSAMETKAVATCEEHSVIGGLGAIVSQVLSASYPVKMAFVGQEDTYGESGKPEELKAKYGLSKDNIIKRAVELLK